MPPSLASHLLPTSQKLCSAKYWHSGWVCSQTLQLDQGCLLHNLCLRTVYQALLRARAAIEGAYMSRRLHRVNRCML